MFSFGSILVYPARSVAFVLAVSVSLHGGDWIVVAGSSFKSGSLSQKQIKDIFLKKKTFIDSQEVIPVNLPASEKGRTIFEDKLLGMERVEIGSYWISQHYQGITPPLTQKSQAGVKAFLKNAKGAIGYIEKTQLDGELKVLYEF
jgi:ABC-type phosphate transport system substrate-binding protein